MEQGGTRKVKGYESALRNIPPSGGGGCHTHLLRIANFGVKCGLSDDDILHDIRRVVHGARHVSNMEIVDAITKARSEKGMPLSVKAFSHIRKRPHPPICGKEFLDALLHNGIGKDEVDLWEASPIRIDWPAEEDSTQTIAYLYGEDERLFVGSRCDSGKPGATIRTSSEWIQHFNAGHGIPEHMIPNPLTGRKGRTKSGRTSYRSDDCVKAFHFAVVEFDNLSREDQIAFWWSINLPVAALIDSGGKSLHGWIRVDCHDTDEWTEQAEDRLFRHYLFPLGVDSACLNESRLSRLPGHRRKETGRWQRLLYLAPKGRRVAV